MEHRMKEFTLLPDAVDALLARAAVGRVTTLGRDGYPYTVAVHFLYRGGKIYFHGLPRGEKLANIAADPRVCFEVDEMSALLLEGVTSPCNADTAYESAVARGNAALLENPEEKRAVLTAIIQKYAPGLAALEMPEARVQGTAVVEITPVSLTGKYHK